MGDMMEFDRDAGPRNRINADVDAVASAGGGAQMTTDPNATAPVRRIPPWFRVVRVLLLVTFVVAVYLLGLSMVHHRFFKGSRVDQFGHVRQ